MLALARMSRISGERCPPRRSRVFSFRSNSQALRPRRVRKFIADLCRGPTPTSIGRLPRLLLHQRRAGGKTARQGARQHGARVQSPHQAGESPVTQPQSYFVTELFKTIIFPDRQLAARSGNRARRYLKRRIVLAAAMLLVTLTTLLLATVNFIDNLDLVRATTRDVAEAAKASPGAGANAEQTGQALGLLLQRVTN